jgi:hypothetical protein
MEFFFVFLFSVLNCVLCALCAFLEERGRFPSIEEDEKPLHLLVGDY